MQQTRIMKLPAFLLRCQTVECVLRVNKSKITSGKTFNGDEFEIGGCHGSSKNEKAFFENFCIFVIIALTLIPRNTYMSVFRSIVWFFPFLDHFQSVLEARSKLILF